MGKKARKRWRKQAARSDSLSAAGYKQIAKKERKKSNNSPPKGGPAVLMCSDGMAAEFDALDDDD